MFSRRFATLSANLLQQESSVIRNFLIKLISRLFMPGIAKEMEREGQFDFQKRGPEEEYDYSQYIQVEDNGSDVTIVSFAGMAVLFAGMPQFEFRHMLKRAAKGCNLVFVRDLRRAGYCQAPDGTPTGLDFYERIVGDALKQLGSKYNIAMGASAGGAGAFYVSSRLPIHQIITFSPGFPPEVYFNRRTQLSTYFNLWRLIREPAAYFEVLLVTVGGMYVYHRACKLLGEKGIPDITGDYLKIKPAPPRATIFYGERCVPDRNQALLHRDIPQVTIRPVDTGRHNCAGFLRKQGQLVAVLTEEIEAGLSAWRERTGMADTTPAMEQ